MINYMLNSAMLWSYKSNYYSNYCATRVYTYNYNPQLYNY